MGDTKHRFADKQANMKERTTTVTCSCGTRFKFTWGKAWENEFISGSQDCGLLHFKWAGGQLDG
jgi:hypothetical protein